MSWHRISRYVSSVLVRVILALVLLSAWVVAGTAPGWLRVIGLEIQAACRDAGTQWMMMVCLASYFVTFLFLDRKLSQPQKNTKNAKGETTPLTSGFCPPSSISAILASFRGKIANPDCWLVGFVGLVLLRYAFAYETAARSLQPLVLLAGIAFGKGIALWGAWQPSLKAKVQGLKLEGDDSSGCGTFALSAAEKRPEAQGVSAPSSINHQLSTFNRTQVLLSILVFLLAASALWQPEYGMDFQYRGQRRWTGAWDNPNIYGLLMGVGTVLAVGLFVQSLKSKGQSRSTSKCGARSTECPPFNYQLRTIHYAQGLLLLAAVGLCAYGLVKSYSRGAWVGTACGLGWLLWQWISRANLTPALSPRPPGGEGESLPRLASRPTRHASRNFWLSASVLLASALVLSFWQFRHTENPLARRVFSIGNPNDFSWRNRVATWSGAVTMMKDRPWVGHGWGKSETVFREQYKPVHLEDTAAIQMNDYLMLGISCGLPALLCLLVYLALAVGRGSNVEGRAPVGLQPSVAAAAGATVLLIGFWFDGGLFKLATSAVFWVLIELSRGSSRGNEAHANGDRARPSVRAVGDAETAARHLTPALSPFEAEREGGAHGVPRPTIALRWLTGILAALAIAQTVLQLGTPRLAVSERTLSLARKFLVPPKAKKDFEFLAAEPIWSARKLGTLLEQVELANYNRELVNWKLPDDVYRQFVLSPPIDAALDGDMDWRRPLWESFYPRIRRESSLAAAAAEIVVRHLRERVRLVATPDAPESITAIWQRGHASARGFEVIYVAALRSAGVPARLSPTSKTEFWNGVEWKPAPRPADGSTGSK